MSIGKQKEPISLSRLTTLVFLPMQERQAAEDAFLPARNFGIVFNGMHPSGRSSWAAGAFHNYFESGHSYLSTPIQITGRVTGIPYISENESNLFHLGLGIRYSDAKQPVVARTESEFYLSPIFVETPAIESSHFFTYDLEMYWRKGPFLVGGEYIGSKVISSNFNDPSPFGFNIMGTWAITGEMRSYRKRSGTFDPTPVSKPVGHGGHGAIELAMRYSFIQLNNSNIDGGLMRTTSAGINWWPSPRVQFGCNYRFIVLDRFDQIGKSSGLNVRIMMMLD